ncbi:hypothetical protein EHF33_19545 (plasmid) [Deinococcus psychrotolerans]|uniref:Uncharacterized protein n=1 Tax=Deinococcus psychrotolerans TaxID=2489213 RepID=A0A3G8YIH8_9DEIO|nr:hypothetical protein [Deinococcus psychrotolerans]AZI45079.1 hypothetical protein EHF33_19545 [Deinococcus psychrotolerans]
MMRTPVFERMASKALDHLNAGMSPAAAWERASNEVKCGPETRIKVCPRSAFISLAEHGHIRGYTAGEPNKPLSKNASYCLTGALLLQKDPTLIGKRSLLWQEIHQQTAC